MSFGANPSLSITRRPSASSSRNAASSDVALPLPRHICESHTERREHAGERVHDDFPHPELPRQSACVLTAGAAEHDQGMLTHVMTTDDGNVTYRLRHVGVCNLTEPGGDLLQGALDAGPLKPGPKVL
jgi:hypothetical protein